MMPSLTDKQIVLRIAKFMRWTGVCWNAMGWFGEFLPTRGLQKLPEWLNSYDAIAPVWVTLYRENLDAYQRATNDLNAWAFSIWFHKSAREHAEAIAVALGGEQ